MAKNSIHRKIEHSPEEKARDQAVRDQLKNHPTPEELVSSGECSEPIPQGVVLDAMLLLAQLHEAREAANLTLSTLAERTGIDKPALSRLETGRQTNPTLQTMLRYVHGLGKRIVWSIVDDPENPFGAGATETESPPPTDAASKEDANALLASLLIAQTRIAASLLEAHKEPTRFLHEQTRGRATRIKEWLRPEVLDIIRSSSHDPHSQILTIDREGRLAFLCSPEPSTSSVASTYSKQIMRSVKRTETAQSPSRGPDPADK